MPVEKIPGWVERLLLPAVNEIKGDIKAINTRIDSLDEKINARIDSLDGKMDSLRLEKITAMEIKIADLEKRLAIA